MLTDIAQSSPLLFSLGLQRARVVALSADNSLDWIAADLACMALNKPCVPLPHFFSQEQICWAVARAGVDTVLTDQPENPHWSELGFHHSGFSVSGLSKLVRRCAAVDIPPATTKLTFTSGSTGQAKAVCLSAMSQESVAASIASVMLSLGIKRHICALPLSVLLENVAGVYAAMLAGAECIAPSLASMGWRGSSQWNPDDFLRCVQDYQIHSAIILPQMLKSILLANENFDIASLKLLAVGGARVAPELLAEAKRRGLPVFEGYGLSECSSVVCLNLPDAEKAGTVGKPLKHAQVRISDEGELEVAGACFEGYLGDTPVVDKSWLPTGDLASIDQDGYVTIHGRKKNLIISSFGRNISPEWVESELLAYQGILQVAVFGEARPFLVAIIYAPNLSDHLLHEAIQAANRKLPDYAHVVRFLRASEAFSVTNGQATSNGRNRRDVIENRYDRLIQELYEEEK